MMNTNKQETMKMEDIIFAHRNKDYGAYAIRATYGSTVLKSVFLSSSLFLILLYGAYKLTQIAPTPPTKSSDTPLIVSDTVTYEVHPDDEIKPKEDKGDKKVETVTTKDNAIGQLIKDSATDKKVIIDSAFVAKIDAPEVKVGGTGLGGGSNNGSSDSNIGGNGENTSNEPLLAPSEMPEFPGGNDKVLGFLLKNTIYPSYAVESRIQQKFSVRFVVNENGVVINPEILNANVDKTLADEAKRVIKLMPKWKPGKNNNHNVKVYFTVPFQFKLAN
jgi:periplasmic protein TonB